MENKFKSKEFRVQFGKAVRRRRLKLGLSQEDFAEKADVHRTYISSIELGKVSVGLEVAILSDTERFATGTVRATLPYGSPYVGWQQAWHVLATRLGAGYALGAARLSGSTSTPLAYSRTITGLWASPYLFGELQLRVTEGLSVVARGQLGWVTATVTGQVAGGSDLSLDGLWAGGQLGLALAFP